MTADRILADLRAAGFTLTVNDGHLEVGPGSRLTAEQVAAIKQHRDELITLLRGDTAALAAGTPQGPKARWPVAWLL